MVFIGLLLVPTLIAIGMLIFARRRFTLEEFGLQMLAALIVAGVSVAVLLQLNMTDYEILNGRVVSKHSEHVSCSHSYSCHCREECSGSGKNRSCSEVCDTCYDHLFDVDWVVGTNIGHGFRISRVDRQGLREPPRFSQVVVGEPVAVTHMYDNYIKASPDTLFRYQGLVEQYKKQIPPYPIDVYDYYRINRIVLVNGAQVPDPKAWNTKLSELNATLGPGKQSNVVVVIVRALPRDYFYALSQAWLGGKKNDVVVVLDAADDGKIDWVDVMSWTDQEMFKIQLRDALLDVGTLDPDKIFPVVQDHVSRLFVRKHMKDYRYLLSSVTPTPLQFGIALLFGILVAVGLSYFFYMNDPFD